MVMKTQNKKYAMMNRVFMMTLLAGLLSCQKIIDVNLNSVSPKLIIDASISDQPGPYTVTLSQTVDYIQDNTFPPVTGAQVIISDDAGNIETLKEVNAGTYQTSTLQGTTGRTYTLSVNTNSNAYSAVSTMPLPVAIDTIVITTIINKKLKSKNNKLSISFLDPKGITNYYRILEKVTNSQYSNEKLILPTLGSVTTDRLTDGTERTFTPGGNQPQLESGEIVVVSLQCIDQNVYNYLSTAQQNGSTSTTLSNPVSNITNGALGYFSAYSVRSKTIEIP